MDAISSVAATNYLDIWSNSSGQTKTTEAVSQDGDVVELSDEAKEAYRLSESVRRSTELMQVRGLDPEDIDAFREIIKRAEQREGTAKEFLKSLSYDERDLVKRANSYGTRLTDANIDSFSEEGCINMVVEQDYRAKVDLNGDSFLEDGGAKGWHFPPPGAPEEVKDAWDEMSKEMSFKDQMIFSIQFMPIDIPGYPDATLAHGHNFSRDGYPGSVDGWVDLLGDVYDSLDAENKMNQDPQSVQHNKKTMDYLQEFISRLEDE